MSDPAVPRYSALAMAAAIIAFGAVSISSLVSIHRQSQDAQSVTHTYEVLAQIETTMRLATEARRGASGYVATGDPRRLQICLSAQPKAVEAAHRLIALTADNQPQHARALEMLTILDAERNGFLSIIETRNRDAAAATAMLQQTEWVARFARLQAVAASMTDVERQLVEIRNGRRIASLQRAEWIVGTGDAIAFALTIGALIMSEREAHQRRTMQKQLAQAHDELTNRVTDLQRLSNELALLTRMSHMLQSCETRDEAAAVIRQIMPALFSSSHGAVFTIAASRNLVLPLESWPSDGRDVSPFSPSDCWALRRGVLHDSGQGLDVRCKHLRNEPDRTLCVPLTAHGETLGLLQISFPGAAQAAGLATAVAQQLSLAEANLMMQETLRRQAMRDPLTSVYNRRYMEETLAREMHRADRQQKSIGLLLLDFDHFKRYNDTLGHAAGDDLLRSAAAIMQRVVRAEDVVCRYGGDEFVIIMPEIDATTALRRAQRLLDAMQQLPRPDEAAAAVVTVSIGLAMYPENGNEPKVLFDAMDRALYDAKRGGRARVVCVSEKPA